MSENPTYIKGLSAAAKYLSMGKDTARREIKLAGIQPRIIRGHYYFTRADLDQLMDPALNEDQPKQP